MSRPSKCRVVCSLPRTMTFVPVSRAKRQIVIMTVDEYETIRLIDKIGLSQEECSTYMGVARTTVQQIYTTARKKLADALVEGMPLHIEGGNYRLCDAAEKRSACCTCHKYCHDTASDSYPDDTDSEEKNMNVIIPVNEDHETMCVSFARAPFFMVYDTELGKGEAFQNPAAEEQSGAGIKAAQFMLDKNAGALITIRCGENAAGVLKSAGVKIYESQSDKVAKNLAALAEGKLTELDHFTSYHGIR